MCSCGMVSVSVPFADADMYISLSGAEYLHLPLSHVTFMVETGWTEAEYQRLAPGYQIWVINNTESDRELPPTQRHLLCSHWT